jgi:hypothetical protein
MSKLHEAWLDYRAEEYPDETESEVLTPLAAAFEAGWMAAGSSDRRDHPDVRIRPPSERLYLAARIAAWEPVVRAAVEYESLGPFADPLSDAVRAMQKEHWP